MRVELLSQAKLLTKLISQFKLPQTNDDCQNIQMDIPNITNMDYSSSNNYSSDKNVVYSGFTDDKY